MSNLQEAFREAARREFAMIPPEEEIEWEFSPRFERKMRRLIRANNYGYWNLINTSAKRAACIAALIVLLLSTAMAIRPIRERVIQFFIEVYEDFYEITFGEEESDDLYAAPDPASETMTRYTLAQLPEGYYENNFLEVDSILHTTWQNNDGFKIVLDQEFGARKIVWDHNDNEPIAVEHGELYITYQSYNGTHSFMWEEHGYVFYLTLYEEIPMEEILNMIDSLTEAEQ